MNATARALAALATLSLVACERGGAEPAPLPRYEIHAIQSGGAPFVVRFDSATGALEQAPLAGGRRWTALGDAAQIGAPAARPGRFDLDFARSTSIPLTLLRVDRDTGETWRMAYPRDRRWIAYSEASSTDADKKPEPAPTPPTTPPAPQRSSPATSDQAPQWKRALGAVQVEEEARPFADAVRSTRLPTEMRTWAAEQLGNFDSSIAVEPLVAVLDDADFDLVRFAARALRKHQDDPRVPPALEKLAEHPDQKVREAATSKR